MTVVTEPVLVSVPVSQSVYSVFGVRAANTTRHESKHRLFKTTALSKSMEKKQFPRIFDANFG